ncbi:MAG: hypothetical protein CM15mP63_0100 [Gammaproteobacteria bacterium]|nr:MAG: hypothetical protein CM15mP63_0100 [Gammaproteobacteria bacterium]
MLMVYIRQIPNIAKAKRIDVLTYEEMLEMAG